MNDDTFEKNLRARLRQLEHAVPVRDLGMLPLPARVGARPRVFWGLAAAFATAVFVTGAVVGAIVVSEEVGGGPGLFDPGQPLACSGVDAMTPQQAAPVLAAKGWTVTWQIEDSADRSFSLSEVAPAEGRIIDGALVDRHLVLVVDKHPIGPPTLHDC